MLATSIVYDNESMECRVCEEKSNVPGGRNWIEVGKIHCCRAVQVTIKIWFCSFWMRKWSLQVEEGARISFNLGTADWIYILDMVIMSQANHSMKLSCLSCVCQFFVNEHILEINHTKKRNFYFGSQLWRLQSMTSCLCCLGLWWVRMSQKRNTYDCKYPYFIAARD